MKSHWWEGPDWLELLHEEWPSCEIKPDMEIVISERRTVLTATTLDLCRFAFFQKISFNKIVRIMAYVIRFCKNVKINPIDRKKGKLETDEVKTSEKVILKEIQREPFSGGKKFNFRTIKYSDDLLRVKTKTVSRKDLETFRFPVLLPHSYQMDEKLIMSKHVELEHAGTQTLMSCLRESFWIIKSRKTVRSVIRKCTKCGRFSARPLEAVSIPLPEDRIRDAAVFEVTGIDLCGPLKLVGVPDLDTIDSKRLNKRCAYRLKMRQDLRNRFRNEYRGILKDYSRVKGESSIKECNRVLIGDTNNKRINWPLRKVTKMYKGKDGRLRVMEVKTQFGSVMRPIQKLYPLEVTTVDSLSSTERDVENGACLHQDQIPVVTFILTVVTAVLDFSTTSNPNGGRVSQTPNQKGDSSATVEGI
ncbi:uncharacterized protein TNIN_192851 [Trichonephila inaurata madagascariensis]|uniref:Integrase zinc-binding domain-containing protein n=1 Tax=Trichonephila inaurata madagascariensis TaxID=2747483 RepID=A0A8X7CGE3_9ARAC|nr:uncharacterized protein TNIN_192851 [Trichonephila inaurata madagascariensis]